MINRKTHEKMLKITSYQGNANKMTIRLPPQPQLEWLALQSQDMDRKTP